MPKKIPRIDLGWGLKYQVFYLVGLARRLLFGILKIVTPPKLKPHKFSALPYKIGTLNLALKRGFSYFKRYKKVDWKWVLIALLLGLLLAPHAQAAPIPQETPIVLKRPSYVAQIPQTKLPPQNEVASVAEAPSPISITNCGSDPYMAQIYSHESGCRTNAVNPSSGAYGLCQSLPGYKMAVDGADWQTSWATQNTWCTNYAYSRYGSPAAAWAWWLQHSWW